jgi:four helix bundle protein
VEEWGSGGVEEWGSGGVEEWRSGGVGEMARELIKNHRDLDVYQMAFDSAMQIFELSKKFPVEEKYSLTDQIRRASRSVCANLAEAWRKRRYKAAFIAKLSDAEAEAGETQTWLEFAVRCNYLDVETGRNLYRTYNSILRIFVSMIHNSDKWIIPASEKKKGRQADRETGG